MLSAFSIHKKKESAAKECDDKKEGCQSRISRNCFAFDAEMPTRQIIDNR